MRYVFPLCFCDGKYYVFQAWYGFRPAQFVGEAEVHTTVVTFPATAAGRGVT